MALFGPEKSQPFGVGPDLHVALWMAGTSWSVRTWDKRWTPIFSVLRPKFSLEPGSPGSLYSLILLQAPWPRGRSQQGYAAMAGVLEVGQRLSDIAVS